MAKVVSIQCDVPGCEFAHVHNHRADSLEGWVTRTIKDTVRVKLAEGMRDFDAAVTQYACPDHQGDMAFLPPPDLHPEVQEFLAQHAEPAPEHDPRSDGSRQLAVMADPEAELVDATD